MKSIIHISSGLLLIAGSLGVSGCGLQHLKDSNRRLKESNDRLISENNRLEEELAALQRGVAGPEIPPPAVAMPLTSANPPGVAVDTILEKDLFIDLPEVEVARTPEGLRFRFPDKIFFALGQADLTPRGRTTLDSVARLIRARYPTATIRVDGHTDDTPVRKVKFKYPTNWELSTARACTVVRYLTSQGIDSKRIFPAGFGEHRPVTVGNTPTAKSQNRRVEITVLDGQI